MSLLKKLVAPCLALLLAGCAGMGPQESVEGPGNAA
ncbi:MAG: lipoprotein localization factor LolB, partial [Gammaproteobacteria bacterium HGW-Gammaproteobacteria-9]